MKQRIIIIIVVLSLLLLACSSTASPTPLPTSEPLPPPTETPYPIPTETPLPPTATMEPSPTPDPLIFRDDFEGSLGEGWQWIRESPKHWSLTNNEGWLEIIARAGNVGSGSIDNLLLREAPEGDFELETTLKFLPTGNYQIAGLLVYESAANHVLFGRAFCSSPQCVGDGLYMDLIAGGNYAGENFATAAYPGEVVYLRLRREGSTFTAYASEDGSSWKLIGAHKGEVTPLFVGLVSGQAVNSVPKPAQFDQFIINALP